MDRELNRWGRGWAAGPLGGSMVIRTAFIASFLLLGPISCDSSPSSPNGPDPEDPITFTILYTNDEHGWIEEGTGTDGAAKLMGVWKSVEGYQADGSVLVISGGDNWTGPAVSTWFQGEPTVEVMNTMGYTASAIGNHEFDFGVAVLEERVAQAAFPYLAANIRLHSSGGIPGFATPFTIREVNGVRVGMVGLTTTSTPWTAFPPHVEDFQFIPYDEALNEWVPRAWAAGADVVVVLGHICSTAMIELVPLAKSLGVSVLGGGHCHQEVAEVREGIALVVGGSWMASYGKVRVTFDPESGEVSSVVPSIGANRGGTADAAVAAVVSKWQEAADQELSTVIGYTEAGIPNGSAALHNLITDSWLFAYPAADIVMTNGGGVRQGIPSGDITRGTIVGVLPFQNNLVELEMTGTEVASSIAGDIILAGIRVEGEILHSDGTPLKTDSVYRVLTTDYLYARPDLSFALFDPEPYHTGLAYFQPTVLYLESLGTSPGDPLDNHLDHLSRR